MFKTIFCLSLICVIMFGVCGTAVLAQEAGGEWEGSEAAGTWESGGEIENPTGWNTFEDMFGSIIGWLLSIVSLLAVIMIIYGGFQYMISAGNETKIKEAKNTIKWAIFGLVIVVMSYAFLSAIKEILNIRS